jgi:hypothetical protein
MTIIDSPKETAIGEQVQVNWTCSNASFSARGEVVKLNRKSARVKLLQEVPVISFWGERSEPYLVGQEIIVPFPGTIGNCIAK